MLDEVPQVSSPVAQTAPAVDAPIDGEVAQQPQQPGETAAQFELRTSDGSSYRSPEAAFAALEAKAQYIALLERERLAERVQQNQAPRPQPVDDRTQFIEDNVADLMAQGADENSAREFAARQWKTHEFTVNKTKAILQQVQSAQRNSEYLAINAMDPRFDVEHPLYGELVRATRSPDRPPAAHYQYVLKLIGPPNGQAAAVTPAAPAATAATTPFPVRPSFQIPSGGSGPAIAQAPDSELVQRALKMYDESPTARMNPNPAQRARVREEAIKKWG